MLQALDSAAAGMLVQQACLDVTANNLSNVSTTGFKRSRAEFTDLLYAGVRAPGGATFQVGRGARLSGIRRENDQGILIQGDDPFSVAVEGEGLFTLRLPNGNIGYTRAGTLGNDAEGRMTINGSYLLEPPITLPAEMREITISPDGRVLVTSAAGQKPQEVGKITLVKFMNPQGLIALDDGVFVPGPTAGASVQAVPGTSGLGVLRQGYLEGSNVDTITEMTRIISAMRAYEMNSKMVMSADESISVANQILKR